MFFEMINKFINSLRLIKKKGKGHIFKIRNRKVTSAQFLQSLKHYLGDDMNNFMPTNFRI